MHWWTGHSNIPPPPVKNHRSSILKNRGGVLAARGRLETRHGAAGGEPSRHRDLSERLYERTIANREPQWD